MSTGRQVRGRTHQMADTAIMLGVLGVACFLGALVCKCSNANWVNVGYMRSGARRIKVMVWDGGATQGGATYFSRFMEEDTDKLLVEGWIEQEERRDLERLPVRRGTSGEIAAIFLRSTRHGDPDWQFVDLSMVGTGK